MRHMLILLAILIIMFCTSCRYFEQEKQKEKSKIARIISVSELFPEAEISVERGKK